MLGQGQWESPQEQESHRPRWSRSRLPQILWLESGHPGHVARDWGLESHPWMQSSWRSRRRRLVPYQGQGSGVLLLLQARQGDGAFLLQVWQVLGPSFCRCDRGLGPFFFCGQGWVTRRGGTWTLWWGQQQASGEGSHLHLLLQWAPGKECWGYSQRLWDHCSLKDGKA